MVKVASVKGAQRINSSDENEYYEICMPSKLQVYDLLVSRKFSS